MQTCVVSLLNKHGQVVKSWMLKHDYNYAVMSRGHVRGHTLDDKYISISAGEHNNLVIEEK